MMQKQRGMTIWGWLFVLGTIGFLSLVTMKLFPIYMENMSVKKAVKKIADSSGAESLSKHAIWVSLTKQFYVDEVHGITQDDVSIETNDEGGKDLVVSYEVRKTMLYNVDVVVWFEERVPLSE